MDEGEIVFMQLGVSDNNRFVLRHLKYPKTFINANELLEYINSGQPRKYVLCEAPQQHPAAALTNEDFIESGCLKGIDKDESLFVFNS